jgi:catechol 2,3-dioxygenase-like lactoylglutathione lyase family enzyme
MAVKISHIIIPVKSVEEMKKARKFFVDVIGLHVRDGMDDSGWVTEADIWNGEDQRFPTRILHLLDDYGTFVDLVLYENRPVSWAKGVGSGKGFALAFQVPDEQKTWSKLKDYPAQPVYAPGPYPDAGPVLSSKEPWLGVSHSFFAINIGRVSEDGEEQVIELCEMKKK